MTCSQSRRQGPTLQELSHGCALTAAAQHAAAAACLPVKADQLLQVEPVGGTKLWNTTDAAARPHLCVAAVGVDDDQEHLATLCTYTHAHTT